MCSDTDTRLRRKDERPQELLDAALALFVEKGYAATRMDDIAQRVGVTKGTVYLYFESKEALFKAVIQEGIVPVLDYGESMLEELADDPVQLLRCLLEGWWAHIGGTALGGVPKLMIAEARNFPEVARYYNEAVIERGQALLQAALECGMRRGAFRVLDTSMTARLIMAPLVQLALWRHSFAPCCGGARTEDEVPEYLAAHFELMMQGLGVTADSGDGA